MAGTLGFSISVVHVFQRRFDTDSLAEALTGAHLYIISRRPSSRIQRESIMVRGDLVTFNIMTRASIIANVVPYSLSLRPESGLEVEDFRTYSNGAYFSFRCNGRLVHGDAWALASLASNAREDLATQEVLYVGQAFGADGSNDAWKRTRKHSTLQRIYEEHAGEDWDIFISPIVVEKLDRSNVDHIDDDEEPTPNILGMSKDDPFFDIKRKDFLSTSIDLVEHALISYFTPPYNRLLRRWQPDHPTIAMTKLRSEGFRLLQIHLDGWQGLSRYFAREVREARSHLVLLSAVAESGTGSSRIEYDPDVHYWLFQFGLDFTEKLMSEAEKSMVVMKIFGDEAPRVRRPPEAEIPDNSTWSPEDFQQARERLRETIPFTDVSYNPKTGCFAYGRDADGRESYWQLVRPGEGARHGIIVGPRDTGKTNALNLIKLEAYASLIFSLVVLDPTGRHNDTLWREYADVMAETIDASRDALKRLESEVAARHTKGYSFTADGNPILVTIEDAHILFDASPSAAKSAEAIALYGESVGIGMVMTVPDLNVGRFGGSKPMKESFAKAMTAIFGSFDSYEMFTEGD